MRIYLIGFMGCGKSTLGKELASSLNLNFIDLDKYLEERYLKTIPQLFQEEGEQAFRDKERNCLFEVSTFEDVVVAAGGGLPCFYDNMEIMNSSGTSVFLEVSAEELGRRLISSSQDRPLLRNKSEKELIDYIKATLDYRKAFYEQATLTVRGDDIEVSDIIEKTGIVSCGEN